jgi:hypothetical protein
MLFMRNGFYPKYQSQNTKLNVIPRERLAGNEPNNLATSFHWRPRTL